MVGDALILLIVVILGAAARSSGLPLEQFLRYFKDEILVTLGN